METRVVCEEVPAADIVPAGFRPDTTFAFTDGACSQNGRPGARAAFAAVVVNPAQGKAFAVKGLVAAAAYTLDGLALRADAAAPVPPSNNRGELLGMVHAFLSLLETGVGGDIEVVSDSNLCIQTLTAWLPARQKKGTAHELKNLDLVLIAAELLARLRARGAVAFRHVNSHVRFPAGAGALERFLWAGNDAADRLAGAV